MSKPPVRQVWKTDEKGIPRMVFVPTRRVVPLNVTPVPRILRVDPLIPRASSELAGSSRTLSKLTPAPRNSAQLTPTSILTHRSMRQVMAELKYYRWRARLERVKTEHLHANNQLHAERVEREIKRAKRKVKNYAEFNTMELSDISDDDDDGSNTNPMNTDDISEEEEERIPEPEMTEEAEAPEPQRAPSFHLPEQNSSFHFRPSSFPDNGPPLEDQGDSMDTQDELFPFDLPESRMKSFDSTRSYVSEDSAENIASDSEGTIIDEDMLYNATDKTVPYVDSDSE